MSWLSYLFPITLYRGRTANNTLIEVREILGKRKLDLDGYPQSGANYQRYWRHVFARQEMTKLDEYGRALVLGLGGGDLATICAKLLPKWEMTYVELEREIVEVAKQYFGVEGDARRKTVVDDAAVFMANNKQKYDLIVVDLYQGDTVPEFVTSARFLRQIESALSLGGIAIFNYASHEFRDKDFVIFNRQLAKVFESIVRGEYIGHPFYLVAK